MTGWGGGAWGAPPWGGPVLGPLVLVGALAARENVVRLAFSVPVYFSGLLDVPDGSARARYAVEPDAGTRGADGSAARPVRVVTAALAQVPGHLYGAVVDLTLDRPMTPYPAAYTASASGLWAADLLGQLVEPATLQFPSVFRALVVPTLEAPVSNVSGDLANPQTLSAAVISGDGGVVLPSSLGSFVPDDTGDYAADSGLVSYKKRCVRRIITRKGGFAHLGPSYGAGATQYGKRLGNAVSRAQLAGDVEAQIAQEPETASVAVQVVPSSKPGLYKIDVRARTKSGQEVRLIVSAPGG